MLKVGDKAPNFSLPNQNGENVTLDDFSGKKVAYYGCGDQNIYSSSFLDALGILEEKITSKGGTTIGQTSTDGYEYDFSKAEKDGQFVGLGIDNDNEPELTEERVEAWCKSITEQFK